MAIRCLTLFLLLVASGMAFAGTAGVGSRRSAAIPPAAAPTAEQQSVHADLEAVQQVQQAVVTQDVATTANLSLKNNQNTLNFKGLMAGSWAMILGIFALFMLAESRHEATKALIGSALGAAVSMVAAFALKFSGMIHF